MNEIFKKFKDVRMTATEKEAGFNEIKTFVNNNPVQSPWYQNIGNKILSPFQDGLLLHHKMLASAFILVILISATGGTSIAAKYSVPGDILYPVKINLNEKVETFTAIGQEAKASVQASHIDERLSEAEKLGAENKLSDAIKTQLETKFSQDLQSTMNHVDTLNSNGDSKNANKVRVNIENSLQKHKDIVEKILKNDNRRSSKSLQQKSTPTNPEIQSIEVKASTLSVPAMSTTTTIATTTKTFNKEKVESSDSIEYKTPLLDETLKRIRESQEEKED